MRISLFVFLLYGFFACFPSVSEAVLWNKIVASFDSTVLTLWDVKREFHLNHLQKKGFPPTKDELREMAKTMIVEMLIVREAESFGMGVLTTSEMNTIFRQFKKKFKNQSEFQSFMSEYLWTEGELKRVLSRPVRVERFIREKENLRDWIANLKNRSNVRTVWD